MGPLRINPKSWLENRRTWNDGFRFHRPLLLIHSDDWGRVGVRDGDGFEQLRAAGLAQGNNPYDFYSLETADDVTALRELLARHCDSEGRSACIVMNFVTANLDFDRMAEDNFCQLYFRPLQNGLPGAWHRPGLLEAYQSGITAGVFQPALHGTSHFCRAAVNRELVLGTERARLLRMLWQAQTPYIFHLMPWIGYEYWDPERVPKERQLPAVEQAELVRQAHENFIALFGTKPLSACAPGYRSDWNTHRAWLAVGVKVAQNGPGPLRLPSFAEEGVLNLYRNISFEPATNSSFSLAKVWRGVAECFARGCPAIVSMHSINFHSSLKDYRTSTLNFLDQFLTALEKAYPDLLYIDDAELFEIVTSGGPAGKMTNNRFASVVSA